MTTRRVIHTLLAYGVAGLATTVAIAWASAAWAPQKATKVVWHRLQVAGDDYVIAEFRGPGFARISIQRGEAGPRNAPGEMAGWRPPHADQYRLAGPPDDHAPAWSWASEVRRLELPWREAVVVKDDARGWPLLALRCRHRLIPGDSSLTAATVIEGGFGLGGIRDQRLRGAWFDGARFRALPALPIWAGLAANTAFWATCSAGLAGGVGLLRGHVRRSRGLCPRCSYELGQMMESGCPECGWRKPL